MSRLLARTALVQALSLALFCGCLTGCSEPKSSIDPAPFKAAIATYLDQNNMGMVVKEVKEGPTVEGDAATLVASLTRADVGGPSTTWTFRFEKDADGTWKAVGHEN